MMDKLFLESYLMMNMEITFAGVRAWFDMAGMVMDDVPLFRALLLPEKMVIEDQAEFTRLIIYRYEDVFYQVNRTCFSTDGDADPLRDEYDPIHQLLIRLMNTLSLSGEQNAMIDLGLELNLDRKRETPLYPSLHSFF
ncbi:hypothetical protein [Paenibacillus sp. PL91]|uniref:hypothetical protein n=1 Tax=Paenibacillus sp. PL91 TaxID=2729538 RepID=UPI0016597393|nr:hypothetical protein [Paenibacillus sp. PL91]MBC9204709.1 hypothetical protein [Paenibacillus sp. PL91]